MEQLSPKKGEFYLAEEVGENRFIVLFKGVWGLLADSFIGGGIVRHRWEKEGKGTAVLYHDDDEDQMK